jgi:hypothetical protein
MTESPARTGATRASRPGSAIWTLRLWGLSDPRLDIALTVAVVLVLVWSRFALLPSGPWEWDETLFARGILRFDLRAHFPHPPGFPLWLALGYLVQPLVSEPLHGLQLLSSAASVLTLWPLCYLGRRAAPAPIATATALAFMFAPGVWMHSMRGFSATPAAFFALWAAAVAVAGLSGRRATFFTILLTASFLIRPILLPSLGLLWLAGALAVRPRKRLFPGVVIGGAAIVSATVAMILLQGSWASFAAAFADHANRHFNALVNNQGGFNELGIVKGLGGGWIAFTVLVLCALGLVVWARRVGRGAALAWLVVLAVSVAQLFWLQDRAYPRYAVPFQMAAAPLVAAAAGTLASPVGALAGVAFLASYLGITAYPIVVEQHSTMMSGWQALRFAVDLAQRDGFQLVVEPGLLPFTSYLQEVDLSHGKHWNFDVFQAPASPASGDIPTKPYLVVTDYPDRYLDPPLGKVWRFGEVSRELEPLTQQRFISSEVIEGAPLGMSGWRHPAHDERSILFMWGGPDAELILPPFPAGSRLGMDVEPTIGPAPLEVQLNGTAVAEVAGDAPRVRLWFPPGLLHHDTTNEVLFPRFEAYPPSSEPDSLAALRLSGLRVMAPSLPWNGSLVTAADRRALDVAVGAGTAPLTGARLTGTYRPERFPSGTAAWTQPKATLEFPAAPGTLTLTLWAPRPTPADLEVWVNGELFAGPLEVATDPQPLILAFGENATKTGRIDLELRSKPYTPQASANENRTLGIVLQAMRFQSLPGYSQADWRAEIDKTTGRWQFVATPRGIYDAEVFGAGPGAWIQPDVRLSVPAGPGRLVLQAACPRSLPSHFEIWSAGRRLAGPLDLPETPSPVAVDLTPELVADGFVHLDLRSAPYYPGRRPGSHDTRVLGVVLGKVAFEPAGAPTESSHRRLPAPPGP